MVEEGMPAEGTEDEGKPEAEEPPQPAAVASNKQRRASAEALQEEGSTDDEGSDDLQVSAYCVSNLCPTDFAEIIFNKPPVMDSMCSCATGADDGTL